MKTYVIDASSSLKLHFPEEEFSEVVEKLFSDFASGEIELIAPSIWLYEAVNGIRTGVLRKRLSADMGAKIVGDLLKLKVNLFDFESLAKRCFKLANQLQISVYDASYIAMAKKKRVTFFTADKKLYKKVKSKVPEIKWIGSTSLYSS